MMLEQLSKTLVPPIVHATELVGVAIITIGAFATLGMFLFHLVRREKFDEAVAQFRSSLGRSILLGLEFLVAADIVNTVVIALTPENVLSLAVIVLIRTLLSISLEAEIEGRFPWQRGERRKEPSSE
jgi:uncharacterized membrane protein